MKNEILMQKALYLKKIRNYFDKLNVLEVDTPLAYSHAVSDPYINAFKISTQSGNRYLQTSPEYAMKHLLANGVGSIYQICKAFRDDEKSTIHNYEFTMLEWYRVGIDYKSFMQEIVVLIKTLDLTASFKQFTYEHVFEEYVGINPHEASLDELQKVVSIKIGNIVGLDNPNIIDCLDILFTHFVEPKIKEFKEYIFIYNYPACQCALARKILENDKVVSARFELFYQGVELANGYYELNDSQEMLDRFNIDNEIRQTNNQQLIDLDEKLLESTANIPECSGVALGLDRLFMLLTESKSISDVLFTC